MSVESDILKSLDLELLVKDFAVMAPSKMELINQTSNSIRCIKILKCLHRAALVHIGMQCKWVSLYSFEKITTLKCNAKLITSQIMNASHFH